MRIGPIYIPKFKSSSNQVKKTPSLVYAKDFLRVLLFCLSKCSAKLEVKNAYAPVVHPNKKRVSYIVVGTKYFLNIKWPFTDNNIREGWFRLACGEL